MVVTKPKWPAPPSRMRVRSLLSRQLRRLLRSGLTKHMADTRTA